MACGGLTAARVFCICATALLPIAARASAPALPSCGCSDDMLWNGRCDDECNTAACDQDMGECGVPAVDAHMKAVEGMCDGAWGSPARRLCTPESPTPYSRTITCAHADATTGYIPTARCGRECAKLLCFNEPACEGVVFHTVASGAVTHFALLAHLNANGRLAVNEGNADRAAPDSLCVVKDSTIACSDTCGTARDGVCTDGASADVASTCEYGTDCTDCGIRRAARTAHGGGAAGRSDLFVPVDFCWTDTHATNRLCADVSKGAAGRGTCKGADNHGVFRAGGCDSACLLAKCAKDSGCAGVRFVNGGSQSGYDADPKHTAVLLWGVGGYEATGSHLPCLVKASHVLCSATCETAGDGVCDDGANVGGVGSCTLGTDCGDCGPRSVPREAKKAEENARDPYVCENACPLWNRDGVCQDGGDGASGSLCPYGLDCADCGERLRADKDKRGHGHAPALPPATEHSHSICEDRCAESTADGTCQDGGSNAAAAAACPYGHDCSDCGARKVTYTTVSCVHNGRHDQLCPSASPACAGSGPDGSFAAVQCDVECLLGRCYAEPACVAVAQLSRGRHVLLHEFEIIENSVTASACYVKEGAGIAVNTSAGRRGGARSGGRGVLAIAALICTVVGIGFAAKWQRARMASMNERVEAEERRDVNDNDDGGGFPRRRPRPHPVIVTQPGLTPELPPQACPEGGFAHRASIATSVMTDSSDVRLYAPPREALEEQSPPPPPSQHQHLGVHESWSTRSTPMATPDAARRCSFGSVTFAPPPEEEFRPRFTPSTSLQSLQNEGIQLTRWLSFSGCDEGAAPVQVTVRQVSPGAGVRKSSLRYSPQPPAPVEDPSEVKPKPEDLTTV